MSLRLQVAFALPLQRFARGVSALVQNPAGPYLARVQVDHRGVGLLALLLKGGIHAILALPGQLSFLPSRQPTPHVRSNGWVPALCGLHGLAAEGPLRGRVEVLQGGSGGVLLRWARQLLRQLRLGAWLLAWRWAGPALASRTPLNLLLLC